MAPHFTGGDLKTAGKLLILKKYLPAYLKIMESNWSGELWYVDTNAGSGKTEVDDGVLLDGSTLIALQQDDPTFDRYYLYEKNEDRFRQLVATIEDEFGYDLEVRNTEIEDFDFLVAECQDPCIKARQIDSNPGVRFLAKDSNENHHWFSFLDPGGLELDIETVDTLIDRGNMDILINFQVTGVKRSAAAEHAVERAIRAMGREDLADGAKTLDEYTEMYCERLREGQTEWRVISKNMESFEDRRYRFDMVFAARVAVARKIIQDIWNKDDFWAEAKQLIEDNRDGDSQSSLGHFG